MSILSETVLEQIDGVIMMFSLEMESSFDHIEKQLEYLKTITK
jgi:hypothetical protein